MERAGQLIEKLYADFRNHANPEQLLISVQLLQKELMQYTHRPDYRKATKKVAVVFPAQHAMFEAPEPQPVTLEAVASAEPEVVAVTLEPLPASQQPQPVAEAQPITVAEPEPVAAVAVKEEPVAIVETAQPAAKEVLPLVMPPDEAGEPEITYEQIPTVAARQPQPVEAGKELNEAMQNNDHSLNDKLKESKTELGDSLSESPLKDLKKGIGLNDRYLYINDLFRGDETMYERSIKTINNFNIYPEAHYWMERELKIKLGWSDDMPVVKQFYALVKRRFV
jgi:hypothetical protein